MKTLIAFLLLFAIYACNGQSSALKEAKKMEKAIKEAPRPGTVATTGGGWTMTAKINGKPWVAGSMLPPSAASRILGYVGEQSYIGLPSFEKRYARVGKKQKINDQMAADIFIKGENTVYTQSIGSMEITAINGDWVEGKFEVAFSGSKTAEPKTITEGFFRVQL